MSLRVFLRMCVSGTACVCVCVRATACTYLKVLRHGSEFVMGVFQLELNNLTLILLQFVIQEKRREENTRSDEK